MDAISVRIKCSKIPEKKGKGKGRERGKRKEKVKGMKKEKGKEREGKGKGKKEKNLWDLNSILYVGVSMWCLADSQAVKQDNYWFCSHIASLQLSFPLALCFVFAFSITEFDLVA